MLVDEGDMLQRAMNGCYHFHVDMGGGHTEKRGKLS